MRNAILSIVLFGAMISPAMAVNDWPGTDCEWLWGRPSSGNFAIYYIDGYATPEFNPSVPIGTVIDSRTIPAQGGEAVIQCGSGIQNTFHGRLTETAEPVYNTYPTTVSGVGVRIRFESSGSWFPLEGNSNGVFVNVSSSVLVVEFVKIGPVTAAGKLQGEIAGSWIKNKLAQYRSIRIRGAIEIKPKVPTCSVGTKNIAVQMNPTGNSFTSRDFGGVGGTTPERDFSIQLNCSGGDQGTSTNAYVTLTDNSNNGNRSNLLSLTPTSKATGVAVQILKDGKPLSFGPDSSSAGNPNQWKAGNIPEGQGVFTIPLTARYIQTGTLKGGTANAVATFTMSYQ